MAESDGMIRVEKAYFPLFINMQQKKLLVFGAGQIAARRTGALLRYGAFVEAAAPHFVEAMYGFWRQYPGQLQLLQRCYCPGEICAERADYVLAATNDADVNAAIVRECRSKNIPVNHAGDRSQCDFYFPALVEREHMVIGITSTDGNHRRTAEFSAYLRRKEL